MLGFAGGCSSIHSIPEICRSVLVAGAAVMSVGAQLAKPTPTIMSSGDSQGVLQGTKLRGQTELKRRLPLIFADSCRRFSPFPRKRSIWEAQIFAEDRRFSQEAAENCRNPQETADQRLSPWVRPRRHVSFFTFS